MAEDSPARLDRYIDDGRLLVATDDRGEVVGHLQLVAAGGAELEIRSLAVRAEVRGRGLGRRLVAHALAAARAEGAASVTVATAMADTGNLRFYQRCGFRATSIEPDAFTPARGYPPDLTSEGIPVRDAVRFAIDLGEVPTGGLRADEGSANSAAPAPAGRVGGCTVGEVSEP
jgi:GNAT superfamily N-acetyltransferase